MFLSSIRLLVPSKRQAPFQVVSLKLGVVEGSVAAKSETVNVALTTERIELGLGKVVRHDLFGENLGLVDLEGSPIREPSNDVSGLLILRMLKQFMKLPRERKFHVDQLVVCIFANILLDHDFDLVLNSSLMTRVVRFSVRSLKIWCLLPCVVPNK